MALPPESKENIPTPEGESPKKGAPQAQAVVDLRAGVTAATESVVQPQNPNQLEVRWRNLLAQLDSLTASFPDSKYPALAELRAEITAGTLGTEKLFVSIGEHVHLVIKPGDTDDVLRDKLTHFVSMLKQTASYVSGETTQEAPLTSTAPEVTWRDILGAIAEVLKNYPADSEQNATLDLLGTLIEQRVLGTGLPYHIEVDTFILDIVETDTDAQLRDKLAHFLRELSKHTQVRVNDEVHKKYAELEKKHRATEAKWKQLEDELGDKKAEAKRLKDELQRERTQQQQKDMRIRTLEDELHDVHNRPSSNRSIPAPTYSRSG